LRCSRSGNGPRSSTISPAIVASCPAAVAGLRGDGREGVEQVLLAALLDQEHLQQALELRRHRNGRSLAEPVPQRRSAPIGDDPAGPRAATHPRFYHWCLPNELMRRWAEQMARLRPDTAHLDLEVAELGTPGERITDVLETSAQLAARRAAIAAHASQTSPYAGLPDDLAAAFLSRDHLIRVA
jgi:LmbE family N-acetylglucosaminyl deacetylase